MLNFTPSSLAASLSSSRRPHFRVSLLLARMMLSAMLRNSDRFGGALSLPNVLVSSLRLVSRIQRSRLSAPYGSTPPSPVVVWFACSR